MSINNLGPQNTQVPQMTDRTPPPAQEPAAAPQGGSDVVELNVPVTLPKEMFVPDKDGKKPIDDFQMQLIPKGAVVTNNDEIKDLVEQVKVQTFNNGLPEASDSKASKIMGITRAIANQAGIIGGSLASYQLMGSSPAGWAGPVALVGGTVGIMTAADGFKKTLDAKAYYNALKAQGKETMSIPVNMKDGTVVNQEVKLDDLIKGANDGLVMQGMQVVGNALTVAAGFGAGPAAAMASVAVQLGAFAYMQRHAVAAVLKKIGGAVKNAAISLKDKFTHTKDRNSAKEQTAQLQTNAPANGINASQQITQQKQVQDTKLSEAST
ncbi:MAG: hypothetical protein AB9903_13290 [Vulcanimicrobiota bacterium]